MGNYKLVTPEGTRDYLFHESTSRSHTAEELCALFEKSSYSRVITPGIEYLDTFLAKNHTIPVEDMYKLSDSNGRLMVLRPDSTTPIARLCATRLKNESLPIRLFYSQAVYSATRQMSGKQNEILQTGVELVGLTDKASDLEVLSLAIKSLKTLSPKGLRLELGHIGLFAELADALSLDAEKREQLRSLIEGKNYPALNDMLDKMGDSNAVFALKQLPRLFGGDEVFTLARDIFKGEKSLELLSYLKSVYDILKKSCLDGEITVDLGIVNRTDYYTGIVFKGYLEGFLGEAVLSGGRYDNLMGAFGRDMGAIGFAVNIDSVSAALEHQDLKQKEKPLRIALTKGRLEKDTIALFQKMGFDCESVINKGRRLILPIADENIEIVLAKAADVITYIENGVCDIGVVGKDTIMEYGGSFFEMIDLGFGKCRFALAAKNDCDFYKGYAEKTIATKYPRVAAEFFKGKEMDIRIVKIEGSVELAPLLSLADAIIDIVETGSTLKENGLSVIEEVAPVSARLIVNTVSMKLFGERISSLIKQIEEAL